MTPELYQRAKEIFQAATELPADKQTAFVEQQAGEDAELCREVMSLLSHHDAGGAKSEGLSVGHLLRQRTPLREIRKFSKRPHASTPQVHQAPVSLKPQSVARRSKRTSPWLLLAALLFCITCGFSMWMVPASRLKITEQLNQQIRTSVSTAETTTDSYFAGLKREAEQLAALPSLRMHALELLKTNDSPELHKKSRELILQGIQEWASRDSSKNQVQDNQAPGGDGSAVPYRVEICNPAGTNVFDSLEPEHEGGLIEAELLPYLVMAMRQQKAMISVHGPSQIRGMDHRSHITALSPIKDDSNHLRGYLIVTHPDWHQGLCRLLATFRFASTSEVYLVNKDGHFVTEPRQLNTLLNSGWFPSQTVWPMALRSVDPGVELEKNNPERHHDLLPLTDAAYKVITGGKGISTDGYRNYAGSETIGGWSWMQDYQVGLIYETSKANAYLALSPIEWTRWGMILSSFAGCCAALASAMKFRGNRGQQVDSVGPYELIKPLATGGMGTVYLARHELLKRPSAVKVIRADRLKPDDIARFDREVRVASRLHCPHTISIFDFGQSKDGQWYFAMEYLDGLTLEKVIVRHGALSIDRVIHILIQVFSSLHEAHQGGLVHRDIKPQNVMLTCRGGCPDFAVVFDFGLAKPVQAEGSLFMTGERVWAGTPLYMAPERIRNPLDADARSDIYSMGVLAYFLLVGHEPFTAADPSALFEEILTVVPPPPSRDANQDIPVELDQLVLNCLHKDSSERPQSAAAVLKELDALACKHPWNRAFATQWWESFARSSEV